MVNPLDFLNEDEYNEAVFQEAQGYQGDARRCPRHPHIVISSADGMFDGLCGACEDDYEVTYYRFTGGPVEDDIPF